MAGEKSVKKLVIKALADLGEIGELDKALGNTEKTGKKAASGITKAFAGIAKAFAGIAGALGLQQITSTLFGLASSADASNKKLTSLFAVAKAGGEDVTEVKKALDDLTADGLVNRDAMAESIKNLLKFGFSLEKTTTFLDANKNLAIKNKEAHFDLSTAIVQMTRGLRNNNSILSDATGVSDNLSNILVKAGLSMQAMTKETEAAAGRQAIYNAFLKDAAPFMGDAAAEADTYSGAMSRLSAETEKAKVSLGTTIAEGLKPILDVLGRLSKWFTNLFSGLSEGSKQIVIIIPVIGALTVALWGLVAAMGAVLLPFVLAAAAIAAVTAGIIALNEALEDDPIGDEIEKIEELKEEYEELTEKQKLNADEKQRLSRLHGDLAESVRGFTSDIGDETQAHVDNTSAIYAEIKALKKRKAEEEAGADITSTVVKELRKNLEEIRLGLFQLSFPGELQVDVDLNVGGIEQTLKLTESELVELKNRFESELKSIGASLKEVKAKTDDLKLPKFKPGGAPKALTDNLFLLNDIEKQVRQVEDAHKDQVKFLLRNKELTSDQLAIKLKLARTLRDERIQAIKIGEATEKISASAEGLAGTLEGIADDNLPAILSGASKIAGAFSPVAGKILAAFSVVTSSIKRIVDLINDEEGKQRDIERAIEAQAAAEERRKELLESEIELLKLKLDIEKQLRDTIGDQLDNQLRINELFIDDPIELAKANLEAYTKAAKEGGKSAITTAEELQAAQEKSVGLTELSGFMGLASNALSKITATSPIGKIQETASFLASLLSKVSPIQSTDIQTAIHFLNGLISQKEELSGIGISPDIAGDTAKRLELKGSIKGTIELIEGFGSTFDKMSLSIQDAVEELDQAIELGIGVVEAQQKLDDLLAEAAEKKESEAAEKQRNLIDEIIRNKDQRIAGDKLVLTEDEDQEKRLELERKITQNAIARIQDILGLGELDLSSAAGIRQLTNLIVREEDPLRKAQLEALFGQTSILADLLKSSEEIAENTTPLNVISDRPVSFIETGAGGAGGVFSAMTGIGGALQVNPEALQLPAGLASFAVSGLPTQGDQVSQMVNSLKTLIELGEESNSLSKTQIEALLNIGALFGESPTLTADSAKNWLIETREEIGQESL